MIKISILTTENRRFLGHVIDINCVTFNVRNREGQCIFKGYEIISYKTRPTSPLVSRSIPSENITAIFDGVNVISAGFFLNNTQGVSLIIDGNRDRYVAVIVHLEGECEITVRIGGYNTISSFTGEPQSFISRRKFYFLICNVTILIIFNMTSYHASITGISNEIITN